MAGSFHDDDEEITGINVTPLVDVVLVLLIIFMVTAKYIVQKSIDVDLPSAETAEPASTKNLSFVLDKEGILYLDGEKITVGDVAEKVALARAEAASGQPVQALIASDQKTSYGHVMRLIDMVRKSGIEFALEVESTTPE